MSVLGRITPQSMEGQMIAVVAGSLAGLLTVMTAWEISKHDSAIQTAENSVTLARIKRLRPILESIDPRQLENLLDVASRCHAGYTVTATPFGRLRSTPETERLRDRLTRDLALDVAHIRVGHAHLTYEDFSYRKCHHSEIDLPLEGIVISLRLDSGRWFNTEVHPHEWHIRDKIDWVVRSSGAFLFIGGTAIFFMRRLSRPLRNLTHAAVRFGRGLHVSEVQERGSPDLKRAIEAFNAMQRQVAGEVDRRTQTLAAISHDVRTPLTALRIKAELIADETTRRDLVASIERMERITASALEFLRGESRTEAMRAVDLAALLESECHNFDEVGKPASFRGNATIRYVCRPDALARAVRNLIDNAVKYGGSADVGLRRRSGWVEITVSDHGPGIPSADIPRALEPFERLSSAREGLDRGFGLGLAVVKAIVDGHDGELSLRPQEPHGLVATIRLPAHRMAAAPEDPGT